MIDIADIYAATNEERMKPIDWCRFAASFAWETDIDFHDWHIGDFRLSVSYVGFNRDIIAQVGDSQLIISEYDGSYQIRDTLYGRITIIEQYPPLVDN